MQFIFHSAIASSPLGPNILFIALLYQ